MLQVGAEVFALETSPSVTRDFRARFDRQPFLFRHHLAGDARFKLDRIREVAAHVGNRASFTGQLQAGAPFFVQPADQAMTFDDALSALESGRSWIILKHLEKDAAYAPLLDACIGEASAIVERDLEPLIESRTMSLILSSPGQVTPYHMDSDCNFLCQIAGRKKLYVFDGRDRSVVTEEDEEAHWCGDLHAAHYRADVQARAWSFAMEPGNGVHVPVTFPHWVQNGDEVSISLSINFRFLGRLRGDVFRMNHIIRRLGLHPRPAGASRVADTLKVAALRPARAGIDAVRWLQHHLFKH